ncbi:hypothetical protein OHR68_14075 [Spirillospora sp. NBC_00431]
MSEISMSAGRRANLLDDILSQVIADQRQRALSLLDKLTLEKASDAPCFQVAAAGELVGKTNESEFEKVRDNRCRKLTVSWQQLANNREHQGTRAERQLRAVMWLGMKSGRSAAPDRNGPKLLAALEAAVRQYLHDESVRTNLIARFVDKPTESKVSTGSAVQPVRQPANESVSSESDSPQQDMSKQYFQKVDGYSSRKRWLLPTAFITAAVLIAALGVVIHTMSSNDREKAKRDRFAPNVSASVLYPGDCYGGELVPGKSIERVNQIEQELYKAGKHDDYQARRRALGVADSAITVSLSITAKPDTTASVRIVKVEADRSPAPTGVFLNYGCGDPEDYYHAALNLDANSEVDIIQKSLKPTSFHPLHMLYGDDYLKRVEEELDSTRMRRLFQSFTVSGDQPGHFRLFPFTRDCSCRWKLTLKWDANGHDGWLNVDNRGRPFWTLSPKNLTMYRQNIEWPKKSPQRWINS